MQMVYNEALTIAKSKTEAAAVSASASVAADAMCRLKQDVSATGAIGPVTITSQLLDALAMMSNDPTQAGTWINAAAMHLQWCANAQAMVVRQRGRSLSNSKEQVCTMIAECV